MEELEGRGTKGEEEREEVWSPSRRLPTSAPAGPLPHPSFHHGPDDRHSCDHDSRATYIRGYDYVSVYVITTQYAADARRA